MTVSSINGISFSTLSAVNGKSLSGITAINGQTIAASVCGVNPSAVNATASGWFDGCADSFNGAVSDGTGIGSSTTRWQNRLNTGEYFDQGTPGSRPLYRPSGPNSKPYLEFDGSKALGGNVPSGNFVNVTDWTVFLVVKAKENGDDNYIWQNSGGFFGVRITSASGNRFQHIVFSGGFVTVNSNTVYSTSTWYIVEAYKSSTNINIKVNGDTVVSAACGAAGSVFNTLAIGNGVNMDLAYLAMFDDDIGSTDRDTMRTSLANYYGITLP